MSLNLDFQRDVSIDKDALDLEWLSHPSIYIRYCEESAKASKVAKEAAQRVKTVYAELYALAAYDLAAKGEKVTESSRDSYALTHPNYKAAYQARIDAEYEAEMIQNAVYALGHKKDALQELVRLCLSGYFAGPREPRELSGTALDEWRARKSATAEEARATTSSNVRDRLNSRRSSSTDTEETQERSTRRTIPE